MGMQLPGTGRGCPSRALFWQQPAGKPPLHAPRVGVLSGRAAQLLGIRLQELTLLPEAKSFL